MHSTLALCRILTSSPPTNAKKINTTRYISLSTDHPTKPPHTQSPKTSPPRKFSLLPMTPRSYAQYARTLLSILISLFKKSQPASQPGSFFAPPLQTNKLLYIQYVDDAATAARNGIPAFGGGCHIPTLTIIFLHVLLMESIFLSLASVLALRGWVGVGFAFMCWWGGGGGSQGVGVGVGAGKGFGNGLV